MASPAALAAFFSETDTHTEVIEQSLIALEKDSANQEVINELFRAAHSLKGNAGLVGLTDIHAIATDMESILSDIRGTGGAVGQQVKDKLFEDLDRIKGLVEKARGGAGEAAAPRKDAPAAAAAAEQDDEHPDDEPHGGAREGGEAEGQRPKHAGGRCSYLTFTLGREEYGFVITSVREIILRRHITHVPNTKDFVSGIMNLRGMVIPVVDAKRKLGFAASGDKAENIIIMENEGMVTGVLVDSVKDIVTFEEDMMVPARTALGAMKGDFIDRIGKADKHSILLIDTGKFCDIKEKYY